MEFSKTLTNSRELGHVFKFGNSTFKSFQDAGYAVQFIYVSNYMNLNHAIVEHAYPEIGFYVASTCAGIFTTSSPAARARNGE